jgi:hypothetical protein
VLDREIGDGRAVGLVDDDAGVVEVSEDVAAGAGPVTLLVYVFFCNHAHQSIHSAEALPLYACLLDR